MDGRYCRRHDKSSMAALLPPTLQWRGRCVEDGDAATALHTRMAALLPAARQVDDGGAAMERAFLPPALQTRTAALLPRALHTRTAAPR